MLEQDETTPKFSLSYFNVNQFATKNKFQLLKLSRKSVEIEDFSNSNNAYGVSFDNQSEKNAKYLNELRNELKFSLDVVADRCVSMMPYSERYYETLYQFNSKAKRKRIPVQVNKMQQIPQFSNESRKFTDRFKLPKLEIHHSLRKLSFNDFDTSSSESLTTVAERKKYWDEYLLSLVSKNTAQWLAYDLTKTEPHSTRLKALVENWYGEPPTFREIIQEEAEEVEDTSSEKAKKSYPYKYFMEKVKQRQGHDKEPTAPTYEIQPSSKAKILNLLSAEHIVQADVEETDPYSDETKASFYRLPRVRRRNQKLKPSEKFESVNKTTLNMKEFILHSDPPRRLDTFFSSKIGDKILKTDNQFQNDLLISTEPRQVKLRNGAERIISLDDKIYLKQLQPVWPIVLHDKVPTPNDLETATEIEEGIFKGHNRWEDFPVEEKDSLQLHDDDAKSEITERLESRKHARQHSSLNLIVDQWRKKWQLTQKFSDSSVEELLRDMSDVHPTIRIEAIVTVAKAAAFMESEENTTEKETANPDSLPEVFVQAIEILLDDNHPQVRKAAAIALHSFDRSTKRSYSTLEELLYSKSSIDRWAAVQCLTMSGSSDSHVIAELIDQLMNSEDIIVHEKASHLLSKISEKTKLVHGMLGEKLNSVSWRQRIIICKTIPLLHGIMNKDLLKKLIHIMWNDAHGEVRIAASQVLGKTGNGKAVHDEIVEKLGSKSELTRADALQKIGILKVMTTKIMSRILQCFKDPFVIVRKEACRTCYRLQIQDDICTNNLLELARYDPLFKVKLYAMKALSKLRSENPDVKACFLWAVQFESEEKIRFTALQALLRTVPVNQDIVEILKSRFLVESEPKLVKLLIKALKSISIDPDIDIDTIAEIKTEVRKFLSDKVHIADVILLNEAFDDYMKLRKDMLAFPDGDEKKPLQTVEGDESVESGEEEEEEEKTKEEYNDEENVHRYVRHLDVINEMSRSNTISLSKEASLLSTGSDDVFPELNGGVDWKEDNNMRYGSEEIPSEQFYRDMSSKSNYLEVPCNDVDAIREHSNNYENYVVNKGVSTSKSDQSLSLEGKDDTLKVERTSVDDAANVAPNTEKAEFIVFEVPERSSNKIDDSELDITTEYKLPDLSYSSVPQDDSHIRLNLLEYAKTAMSLPDTLFRKMRTDLFERSVSLNLQEEVNTAVDFEGLNFENDECEIDQTLFENTVE